MKIIILLLTLSFNAFCMGQCIDSFDIVYRGENGVWKVYDRNAPETYELADSIWLNYDETVIVYSFPCDGRLYYDTITGYWKESKMYTFFGDSSGESSFDYIDSYSTNNLKIDTIKILPEYERLFDSITINGNEEPVYHRKRDTVPVILIVIDTSSRISLLMIITDPLSKAKSDGRLPFWIKGYSVREQHAYTEKGIATMPYEGQYYWEHIYFLDEDKKQLPKNIIVWQSKEINPHN